MNEIQGLRDWSAEKIMGWYKKGNDNHYWWCSPNHSMPDSKYNREYFGLWKSDKEQWQPDNPDTGQIWKFIDKMVDLGYELRLYKPTGKKYQYSAEFIDDKFILDDNPCVAILKAAYAALKDI
jgi:hypothetical protein